MASPRLIGLLGGCLLAMVVCPEDLLADKAPKPPRPPFSIANRSPKTIKGTPRTVPLSFTVSSLKPHRTITFTNDLRDASGKIVWNGEAIRMSFDQELSLGVAVSMTLPALPAGPYTLVSQIPDAIRPPLPVFPGTPDASLSLAETTVIPEEESPPQNLPPPLTVETAITIEAMPFQAEEPFTLAIDSPSTLPPGPLQFAATVTVTRVMASPESNPTLVVDLMNDQERVFWREERSLAIPSNKPAVAVLSIMAPPLPAGHYFINARLRDSSGRPIGPLLPPLSDVLAATFNPSTSDPLPKGAIRKPLARLERFNFDRDLLWGVWGGHGVTREALEGMKAAGINTGPKDSYIFRYRWFVDHAPLKSTGLWPEEAFTNRLSSGFEKYKAWMSGIQNDPGFVVMDMYDELGWSTYDEPDKNRLHQLMAWRIREKTPGVATLSKWNAQMQTDCLGWDEVLKDGFPAASGPNAIKLKWAFSAWIPNLIRLRMAAVRELSPVVQLTPGMGAGLMDDFYDSMHNRAYNKYTTVNILGLFTAGLPVYGTLPWSWLINLKPPFEQHSRITWAALAAAGRFFPIYCPGDGYGDKIADSTSKLTSSGDMLKTVHDRIQPLAPVLLATRNRIETGVLYYHPGWASLENGLFEGLLACGIQPDCGTNLTGRNLIVLQTPGSASDTNALIRAAQEGAGLIFTAEAYSNAATAFSLTWSPVPEGAQTNAWTARLGKGWILRLNSLPPLNRPASGAFMSSLLERAGVTQPFRFTDETGAFHPHILGSLVETADRSQAYVIVVTESRTNVQSRFYATDPAIRAVRDLCDSRTLEWKQDSHGRYVDVPLPKGVGTLLALLRDPSDGRLQVTAPPTVAGGDTLSLEIARLPGNGKALRNAHTYRLRFFEAGEKEMPALSTWGTGPSPVGISLPVALTDPEGPWTVQAEDLTDGTTASVKLTKSGASSGQSRSPSDQNQAPFQVILDPTPPLEGDVILMTLKGRVTTSLQDAPEVTLEPAIPPGVLLDSPARLTLRPKPNAPAAFAFTLRLSRNDAQKLRGGRNQGVSIRLTASGIEPIDTHWIVPVNPFQRAPHLIGTVSGGTITLRVDNFTDRDREVTLAFTPSPGWKTGTSSATQRVPAGTTGRFTWPVTWDDPTQLDPGLAWIPLQATVDGNAFTAGTLFLDQNLEQVWQLGALEMKPGNETAWDKTPVDVEFKPEDAEKRGWPKVTTGSVLDWPALIAPLFEKGKVPTSLLAAVTQVRAPEAQQVRLGFAGPTAPARILLNGVPVDADWEALAKKGGIRAEPVELRKGMNSIVLEILLPVPEKAATSLVLQNVTTGKRDRSLRIGATP